MDGATQLEICDAERGIAPKALAAALSRTRPHTAIVVPCFNEAARLLPVEFLRFAERERGVHFIFVDDGSTDETQRLLQELCAHEPSRFSLITLKRNAGQGEAVRQGLLQALDEDAQYLGYWDADLATPLDEIPHFTAALEGEPECLAVLGSRKPKRDNRVQRSPIRLALGRLFAWTATSVLRMRLYDTQCGAKLFRRSPEVAAMVQNAFISRWIFDVELLVRLIRARGSRAAARASIRELPLRAWRDVPGSKLRPLDFARAPWELLRIGLQLYRP